MNLGHLVACEADLQPHEVMLLRHSNSEVHRLRGFGASLDDYTLIQPMNSRYDFLADGKPPIQVVVVIVDDTVYSVLKITGIRRVGTTLSLGSSEFRRFVSAVHGKALPARQFSSEEIPSSALKRRIRGWTSPRTAVARSNGRLFASVEIG